MPSVLLRLDWDTLIEDNQYRGDPYVPDLEGILTAMIAADKAQSTDPQRRSFQKMRTNPDVYRDSCRAEAEKQWGYGDLVSDHAERVTQAMEQDEDPAEFIKWLGEKYNLTPRSDWAA